jgi:hypothetical protein
LFYWYWWSLWLSLFINFLFISINERNWFAESMFFVGIHWMEFVFHVNFHRLQTQRYIHQLIIHHLSIGGWFKRMELIEVKSLIWAEKGKLYIIYENVMWIQWPTIPVWGFQLIFRMHNSDHTPQGVENRNILLWFKCVLTALHVNCMLLFDKVPFT